MLFRFFLPISPNPLKTRKNVLIRTFKKLILGPKQAKNRPKMAWNSQNQNFLQTDRCFLDFFCQSHSFHIELGKIYSLGPLKSNTRAITGQKWPNMAQIRISFKLIVVIRTFLPVLLILHWTKKNILIWTLQHLYRGHNRLKTGQKWP